MSSLTNIGAGAGIASAAPSDTSVTFCNNNDPILTIQSDGTIRWHSGYKVDEAASMFAKSVQFGAAETIGLSAEVRRTISNDIYDGLETLIKNNGPLTLYDLTNERECCIIMSKLSTQGIV